MWWCCPGQPKVYPEDERSTLPRTSQEQLVKGIRVESLRLLVVTWNMHGKVLVFM